MPSYRPGETAVIVIMPTLAGKKQTGLSPTIDIYDNATGAVLVNDGAMTEVSTDGAYYYSYTTPSPAEGEFQWAAYVGSKVVATGDFITLSDALGDYRPGDTARFMSALTQAGEPDTGESVTVDVYRLSDRSKIVNGGSATEIGASGIYFYSYTIPSGENAYFVVFKKGTDIFRTRNVVTRTAGADSYTIFTAVNTIDGYIDDELAGYGITQQTTAEVIRAINEAIQEIQYRFGVMYDDFVYTVASGGHTYQIDSVYPHPDEVDSVWYGLDSGEVELCKTGRDITRMDIAAGVATVTRYSLYKDGANSYIQLGGIPSATSALRLHGPYTLMRVAAGDTMPLKNKYDYAVEAIAVSILVQESINDAAIKDHARSVADRKLAALQPPESLEKVNDEDPAV